MELDDAQAVDRLLRHSARGVHMPAHEAGHHVDNPDEYAGGATDATLSGDGAVAGIHADCIMGQNMTKTEKRHYHAFVAMTAKLYNAKSGRSEKFEAIDK